MSQNNKPDVLSGFFNKNMIANDTATSCRPITLLAVLGLSIPLSKSASSILLGLACVYMLVLAAGHGCRKISSASFKQPLALSFLIFAVVALTGAVFSTQVTKGLSVALLCISGLGVYLSTAVLLDRCENYEERAREYLLLSFVAGMAILDLVGICGLIKYINTEDIDIIKDMKVILDILLPLRPMKVHQIWFGNLNAIAFYVTVFLLLSSRVTKAKKVKICLYGFAALSATCVLFSMSRTAWAGMLVTVPVASFFLAGNKKIYALAMLCAPVVFFLLYMNSYIVAERVHQMLNDISMILSSDTSSLSSLGDRILMWQASLKMLKAHPITGVGTGGYPAAVAGYIEAGELPARLAAFNQPHNTYLFAAATNGVIGLSAVLFLFYKTLQTSISVMKKNGGRLPGLLALATGIHFVIVSFSESMLYIQMLMFTFSFVMGICLNKACTGAWYTNDGAVPAEQ